MKALFLALTFLGAPLSAQQGFDVSVTEACMADALGYEEQQYCVGAAARQCMEYLEDSQGFAGCAGAEAAWWEARINGSFARISSAANEEQANALAKMQAAWLAYRDEICAFEQVFGAGEAVSEAECLLWKTGDQAVFLEDYLPRN